MGDELNTVDWVVSLGAADAFVMIDSMANFAILSPGRTSFASRLSTWYTMISTTATRTFVFVLVVFVDLSMLR